MAENQFIHLFEFEAGAINNKMVYSHNSPRKPLDIYSLYILYHMGIE